MSSTIVQIRLSVSNNAGIARPLPLSIKETSLPSLPSPLQLRDRNGIFACGLGRPGRPGRLLLVKPDRLLRRWRPALLWYRGGVAGVQEADHPLVWRQLQQLVQGGSVPQRAAAEVRPDAQAPGAEHEGVCCPEDCPVVFFPQLRVVVSPCRHDDD